MADMTFALFLLLSLSAYGLASLFYLAQESIAETTAARDLFTLIGCLCAAVLLTAGWVQTVCRLVAVD
jgi:hypothetical protein